MPDTIFHAAIKSFFVTIFAMFGIALGLIPIILAIGSLSSLEDTLEVKTHYTPIAMANADGSTKVLDKTSPVMLKVNINGFIGTEQLSTQSVMNELIESQQGILKNERVKGILLCINSPGGTVTDSNGIYHLIKAYKQKYKVPVYAHVDGLCASGGMYIACSADKIYATDVSVIGSVGVMLSTAFNLSELMNKVGVESKTITAGKGKDELNPFRPWKEGEDAPMKTLTDAMYVQFINVVTSSRPHMNKEKLINEYGASIFTTDKALEIGFIDGISNSLDDTMRLLAKEMKVEENKYQVVQMEGKFWFTNFLTSKSPLLSGVIKHEFQLRQMNEWINYMY